MAKQIRKRKVRRIKNTFPIIMFICSVCCYVLTVSFVRTMNNSLAVELQRMNNKREELIVANDALKVEIQRLSSRDRVTAVALDNGQDYRPENIVTITVD